MPLAIPCRNAIGVQLSTREIGESCRISQGSSEAHPGAVHFCLILFPHSSIYAVQQMKDITRTRGYRGVKRVDRLLSRQVTAPQVSIARPFYLELQQKAGLDSGRTQLTRMNAMRMT